MTRRSCTGSHRPDCVDRRPARRSAGGRRSRRRPQRRADAPLTLQAVLDQARANSQQFRAAQLASDLAAEDRKQARAALLPSLNGFSQYIYTQPNGTPSGVWVPNDGPNIYAMWLNVHGDVFSLPKWAEYRSAAAAEAVARAKADVAARGLVATIVAELLHAGRRRSGSSPARSRACARRSSSSTSRRSRRAAARSRTPTSSRRRFRSRSALRDAQDAELAVLKSRLGLSVLDLPRLPRHLHRRRRSADDGAAAAARPT